MQNAPHTSSPESQDVAFPVERGRSEYSDHPEASSGRAAKKKKMRILESVFQETSGFEFRSALRCSDLRTSRFESLPWQRWQEKKKEIKERFPSFD
jgi:hypothetical protein